MKKTLATAVLLVVIHVLGMLAGCCTEHYTLCVKFNGFTALNLDNTGAVPVFQTSDTIPAAAYTLRLSMDVEEDFCHENNSVNWSPLNSALATSCGEKFTLVLEDSIVALSITGLSDFDAAHPAGSDLTGLFIGPETYKLNGQTGDDFEYSYIDDYHFFLVKKPDAVRQYQFIATLIFSSGAVVSDTTNTVILGL